MNNPDDNLMQLVRLMEGALSSDVERSLRLKLAEDRPLRQRFGQLLKIRDQSPLVVGKPFRTQAVDEQTLAAFVDGRLDVEEAQQVEAICWESPVVFSELISAFRFNREIAAEGDVVVSPRLTNRLLALVKDVSDASPVDESMFPVLENRDLSIALPRVEAPRPKQRISSLLFAGGAIAATALLTAFVWYLVDRQPGRPQMADDKKWQSPVIEQDPDRSDPSEKNIEEKRIVDTGDEPSDQRPAEPQIVKNMDPKEQPNPPPRTRPGAISWMETSGLIARRDGNSAKWVGLNYGNPGTEPISYNALPGSWAEAKFSQGFSLVLDADSQVEVSDVSESGKLPSIDIDHGRVALLNLAQSQRVQVQVGPVEWNLEAAQDGTSLGVVWNETRPKLMVATGAVAVEGRRYGRRREVTWTNGDFENARSLRGDTKWFSGPPTASTIDDEWRRAMMLSKDLQVSLLTIEPDQSPETRLEMMNWSFALYGQQALPRVLVSKNAIERRQAVSWMLSVGTGDKRLHNVLEALGARVNDQNLPDKIRLWLQAVRDPKLITTEVLTELLRSLSSPYLELRHIGDQLLRVITGQDPAFRPDASAADRKRDVGQWVMILRRFATKNR